MSTNLHAGGRRHDLDWLRVLAFGVLVYFHAAVAFVSNPLPMTVNAELSPFMGSAVFFSSQFRLGLLFFVSGCGVFYALRRRDRNAFFAERSVRLLIPLAFGIVVLVPLMVYLEKRYIDAIEPGFMRFYATYFTNGVYPSGSLSWHHFWFIAYLYLFCLLGWSVFSKLRAQQTWPWLARLLARSHTSVWPLYSVLLPLILIEFVLRPVFPGFRDLVHDWASFSQWFILFVCGYLFASHAHLLEQAARLRTLNLSLAIATAAALLVYFYDATSFSVRVLAGDHWDALRFSVFSLLRAVNAWLWLLVCVGYAAHYLNRPSRSIKYLNQAVYPFFCMHLPVLVALEYWILPLDLSIAAKYWLITTLAVISILVLYEMLRRVQVMRPFIGLKSTA